MSVERTKKTVQMIQFQRQVSFTILNKILWKLAATNKTTFDQGQEGRLCLKLAPIFMVV